MQFRAEVDDRGSRRVIRLAGRLEREQSAELVALCERAGTFVRLDLTDLVSADAHGLEALRALRGRGHQLLGASPYLALQLGRGTSNGTPKRFGSVNSKVMSSGDRPQDTKREEEKE